MLAVAEMTEEQLRNEVDHWRGDAACRLKNAITLARVAEERGQEDEVARITVADILPTYAALRDALSGEVLWPLCEGCSTPLAEGDAIFLYEEGEQAHVNCDQPQMADPLPEGAERFVPYTEFGPEGIGRIFRTARDWLGGR